MTVAIKVWNSTAYTGNACTLRFLKIKKRMVLSALLSKEKIVVLQVFIRKLKYIFFYSDIIFQSPYSISFYMKSASGNGFPIEWTRTNQSVSRISEWPRALCASALGLISRAHNSHTIHLFTTHLQLLIVPFGDCDQRARFNGQLVDFFLYYNLIL